MKKHKFMNFFVGAIIMITTEMFAAGCASNNSTDKFASGVKSETTAPQEVKPIVNEDGITVFPPNTISKAKSGEKMGKAERVVYYSKTAEKKKNAMVLLPPNYSTDKKYPVLYILHGIFGDENSMVGGTRFTVGNLINSGEMPEAIVVYPFMYTSKTKANCTGFDEENVAAYDIFVEDLADSLMPYLAEKYPILEGRENTAITGFSMGGREALAIGFMRPDLFAYVGAIAPAPGLVPAKDWAMTHKGQFAENDLKFKDGDPLPKLLMICAGDNDNTVGKFPRSYHTLLNKNSVDHIWWEIPGSDHGDPAITSGIYNFCQRIFK